MTRLIRAALTAPRSFDPEARTFEAIAATEADVDRGDYLERLLMAGANRSRLVGAPFVDSHDLSSIDKQFGVITATWIEGGKLIVRIRLNARAEPYFAEIAAGELGAISIGYSVEEWQTAPGPGNKPVRIARKWTPLEVSLVSLPADAGAHVRSMRMEDKETEARPIEDYKFPEPLRAGWHWSGELGEGGAVIWTATENPSEEAREICRSARLRDMQRRQAATPLRAAAVVGASSEDPAVINAHIGEALYARSNPRHALSAPARAYYGLSMAEISRDILRRGGVAVSGQGASSIITRALHTTSDFSVILGDTVGRTLREAYGTVPSGVQTLARQTTMRDFRKKTRIMLSDFPTLEPVGEGGEFTSGTMQEAKETFGIATFGRIIGISRQALVNDDLGAFTDMSARIGRAARAFEAAELTKRLVLNPAMDDGQPVFAAAHGNIGASTALAEAGLNAARLALRKQTGLSGELIDVAPKYLLVPAELETAAEKLLATIQPTTTADANPFANLSLVVDPRLTHASRWYLVADPASVEGLEYAYLEGAPGPQIESRNGFEIDGVQIKVRLDFGCGWVDHRGWWASGHV